MPELYSDSFLATVNRQAPHPVSPPPGRQPNVPLLQQIQKAVGEADVLAALAPSFKKLQVEFGDETNEVDSTVNNLNRFLVAPQKGNCNIAILYGNLNRNSVYVFLHEDNGTFPYKLTYHSFNPSTMAHVSEHACSYMYESIGTQGRHAAFEPAKDASQVGALALYYFSRLKRLGCTYPLMNELTKQLQAMCRSIPKSQPHQASNSAQKREVRHPETKMTTIVAPQAPKKFGPKAVAFSAPPHIQRGGMQGGPNNPQPKPTNIGLAAPSPRPGGRPHQKRPAPTQLGPDWGRKKRRDQADQKNGGGGADLTRLDNSRTTERVHMHKNIKMERDTEVDRTPRASSSIEIFGTRPSSMAVNHQVASSRTIDPGQFHSKNLRITSSPMTFNSPYHAPAARASYPFLGARNTGGLPPGTSTSRSNDGFQARTHSSVSHTKPFLSAYPTTNYQLPNLHTFAGHNLMGDLQAAQEQERVASTDVQEVQRQIVTARQDIAGMRNRYMELQAACARLRPAIIQAEQGLNDLEKHENDLNLLVTVCRDEQRAIVDTMNPFMRGMIELGRQMERRNN